MQAFSNNSINPLYTLRMPGGRPTSKEPTFLGAQLAKARETAGLSQNELAEKTGFSRSLIAQWERSAVSLKSDQVILLAEALNISIDELFGRKAPKPKANGPVGKVKRVFEEVSTLPRSQQQRILATVEDMLIASRAKAS